ncbi:ABC transporter substrate-binding protein [Variovorax arabinosiphilus]|uniref:ABC transporter substrate-binding protein n=1 Tax=Variovorax arabinosiphilus TaxID=3053498 RepID=UPI0025764744|nr:MULTISPECIES: ABC transporter substrate-binding protein [unclassified Variovorax]MDM0119041.1 ABC transporter substrate-binding protein [Variovorax sp. J2L1-78]MDM0129467.1 ABC transporter substrate-binding protein [Variovorax sp. J2L1-63]MDM0232747.1 ABC transporter substrate-binding protein [Variovorax sp. J2R1-6]
MFFSTPSFPLRSALLAALLAVGLAAHAAPPNHSGTLTLLTTSEPTALVTIGNVATPILSVSAKVTEGLLKYDYDVNPQPQLATQWTISPDGLTYTFTLRQGVKWHDGRDFTSADVAYSIELLKKIHPRGRNTFANLTAIDTPDKYTAVLRLSKPAPYLIRALVATETPIVPRHIYEGTDPASNPNNNAPVGTGPFKFKEWVRGSHIVYERNTDYWDKPKPFVDQLIVRFVTDPAAAAVAFETGTVDLGYRTPVPLADLERLKKVPALRFETKGNSYSSNVTRLEFNLDNAYFKNEKVRQAVAHTVDRNVIVKVVNYGYGQVSYSPIAPGLKAFHDPAPSPYAVDLKKANALLDEAGYPKKAGGVRFSVPLDFNPIGADGARLADYLRSTLARIGIAVTVRAQDPSAFIKRIYTDRDFAFTTNGASNLFDPTVGVQRLYWSKNFIKGVPFSNGTHYQNPVVDKLLEDAAVENDRAKRLKLFKDFQDTVARDVPDLNLYQPVFITIANQRVHDHSLTADGVESNLADVWVDGAKK